jgi:hypothetical protein
MRFYVAGYFGARERLALMAAEIERRGHTVTSEWLKQTEPSIGMPSLDLAKEYAQRDIFDIARAHTLIYDTLDETIRQARTVEWGISIGQRKHRILIGPGVLPGMFVTSAHELYPTWDALFAKWDLKSASALSAREFTL